LTIICVYLCVIIIMTVLTMNFRQPRVLVIHWFLL
jgi:hypothetical protein